MIELTIPSISCAHCVRTVTETLQPLDPQAQVEVDLPSKTVRVESTRSLAEIRSALDEEGYAPAP